MKLDAETWARIFPLLEKAQAIAPSELPAWIARTVEEHPELEGPLREALAHDAQIADEAFVSPSFYVANRPPRTGQSIGAYTIESLLANGGMGEVWLARRSDGRFEGRFAVKLLQLDAPGLKALDRFKREGRLLARLVHPHIARLIDAGATVGGQPFLVLEYIEGEHVDKFCAVRSLATRSRVKLFLDILAAVAHAHASLIIHRDIKPSNVLVTPNGQVKLLDFGIAKLVDPELTLEDRGQVTRMEDVALTPNYAAPEQVLGEPLSTATDVYQLGVLLHVLLAGRLPRDKIDASRSERLKSALTDSPTRLSDAAAGTLQKELQGDLDAIVEKSLRKQPQERYATAAAFAADLRHYLNNEPVAAREGALTYRAKKFIRRHRRAVLATAATFILLASAAVFALLQMREAQSQRDQARFQEKRADAENQFLTQVLSTVGADGSPVTSTQILDKGVSMLDRMYANDPAFRADLLLRMALGFMTMNDVAKARESLEKARAIAAQFSDPAWVAKIECTTAQFEIAQEQADQARASLQKGRAALALLRNPNAVDSARCSLAQSELFTQNEAIPQALAAARTALEMLEANGQTADPLYGDAMSSVLGLYGATGNSRDSYAFAAREVRVLESSGQGESQTSVGARHNLATTLAGMGEFKAAAAEEDIAVKRMRTGMGDEPMPAVVMLTYGGILQKVDRIEEGLRAEEEAIGAAVREKSATTEAYAHQGRARLLLEAGRLDEAEEEIAVNKRLMAGGEPKFSRMAAMSGGVEADVLRKRGKLTEANTLIQSTIERAEKNSLATSSAGFRYLTIVSGKIAIAEKRFSDAGAAATAALLVDEQRARDPALSANVGESLLLLATAQRGLGQAAEARSTAGRAYLSLKAGLGPEVRATLEAAQFE